MFQVLRISLYGNIIRMADIRFDLGIIFNGDTNLGLEKISYPYLDPRC
jgi:hypothetical protein